MDALWVNLFFEVVNYIIALFFIQRFTDKKFRKTSYFVILIASALGMFTNRAIDIYAVHLGMIKPIVSIVLQILVFDFAFKINVIGSSLYCFILLVISAVANIITVFVLYLLGFDVNPSKLLSNPWASFLGQILTIIFSVLIMVMIYYGKNSFGNASTGTKKIFYTITMATFGVLSANSCIYIILLREYKLKSWFFISLTVILIIFSLLIVFLVKKFHYYGTKEIELEQQKFYNNTLKETLYGMKRFKHDFSNNISVMQVMLNKKQYSDLENYMDELLAYNDGLSLQNMMLNVDNAAIYGLLISKFKYAETLKVKLNLKVYNNIGEIGNVKMLDLCEILGIIIDNAIEAVTGKEENDVFVEIVNEELCKKFTIINCFNGGKEVFNKMRQNNYTSKGENHGNGLAIVRNIVKTNKFLQHNMSLSRGESNIIQEIIINS